MATFLSLDEDRILGLLNLGQWQDTWGMSPAPLPGGGGRGLLSLKLYVPQKNSSRKRPCVGLAVGAGHPTLLCSEALHSLGCEVHYL